MGTLLSMNSTVSMDQNGECALNEDYGFSYLYTFNETFINEYHYNLCYTMVAMEDWLSVTLPKLMLPLAFLLVILTLFGRDKEDYKWFIFHTAFLNFLLGVSREITFYKAISILYSFIDYGISLGVNSIFPLAFTRFFYLYFPRLYDKIFHKHFIFIWLILYDCFIACLDYVNSVQYNVDFDLFHVGVYIFLLLSTILCSILIFLKIREMQQLLESHTNFTTYSDLNRAAFICTFQASIVLLTLFNKVFVILFIKYMAQNKRLFDAFFIYYMFLVPIHYCLYYFFVIVDTLVTLFVLRSNRAVFQNVYRNVKRCLRRSLRRKTSVVHVNQPTTVRATSIVSTTKF